MAIRENKHTVHIEDWVNGIKGSFVGWVDATDKMPDSGNQRGYQMIYYPAGDANKSWMYKISTIISKVIYNIMGEEAVNYTGLKVTDTVYPKSQIEGFNGGVNFSNPNSADDVPMFRVILYEDKDGNSPYADKFAPGNEDVQSKVSKLEEEKRELKQKLDAADIEMDELEDKVGDDNQDQNQNNQYSDDMAIFHDAVDDDSMNNTV